MARQRRIYTREPAIDRTAAEGLSEEHEYLPLGSAPIPTSGSEVLRRLMAENSELADLVPGIFAVEIDMSGHDITAIRAEAFVDDLADQIKELTDTPPAPPAEEQTPEPPQEPEPAMPLTQEVPARVGLIRAHGAVKSVGPINGAAEVRDLDFTWIVDAEDRVWIRIEATRLQGVFGVTIDPVAAAHEMERIAAELLVEEFDLPKSVKVDRISIDADTPQRSRLRVRARARIRWRFIACTLRLNVEIRIERSRLSRAPELRYSVHFFTRHPLLRWVVAYARMQAAQDLRGTEDLTETGLTELTFRMGDAEPGTQSGTVRQVLHIDGAFVEDADR